jgi:diaminopimelate epimerase
LSKSIQFSKYQGLGNDFILIDNTKQSNPILTPEEGIKLCDRNFGIGADGVIFALPGINGCDYTMRIYNSDGSEPQMCGNGIRCLAKYLHQEIEKRPISEEVSYQIWTNAGKIIPGLKHGEITVDMGEPILSPNKIPTTLQPTIDGIAVEAPITVLDKEFKATAVSMGNPHVV